MFGLLPLAMVLSVLLGNLLRNAFSYTDAGEVTVEVERGRVVIRATGVGIAPEKVGEMYRPFVRADESRRGWPWRGSDDRATAVRSLRLAGRDRERTGRRHARRDPLSGCAHGARHGLTEPRRGGWQRYFGATGAAGSAAATVAGSATAAGSEDVAVPSGTRPRRVCFSSCSFFRASSRWRFRNR
jgi:hypothetical protein